jgi:hypothetical protein
MAEGAKVKVKTVKARIHCPSCGYHGGGKMDPEDPLKHLVACPSKLVFPLISPSLMSFPGSLLFFY